MTAVPARRPAAQLPNSPSRLAGDDPSRPVHGARADTPDGIVAQLYRVAAELDGLVDHDEIVQTVTDRACELVGAAFGALFYNALDDAGESYVLYALSGLPRDAFASYPLPRNTAIFEPTFRGTGTLRLDDVRADPRYGRSDPHRGMPPGHPPVVSYLATPVVTRSGEVLGGLFFAHHEPARFTAEHEAVVRAVASHAATAIEHARRYDREHSLTDVLQQSLLPQELPNLPDVELGVAYRSAGRRADVGGDWYDALATADGRVLLTVGDVVGHNLGAAVAMGQLRIALRVYAIDGTGPARAVERLDEFVRVTAATSMATVLVAAYDRAAHTLRVASAGHPPPVVVGADGAARIVELRPAPPVGTGLLVAGAVAEHEVRLAPGDTVLLYTDGLVERRGEPISAGITRLRGAAAAAAGETAAAVAKRLVDELTDPEERRDDTALLVLRVAP